MIKMQDKILNHLDKIARDNELELAISYNASNTGQVYFMDNLTSVLAITFNFQSSHCSLNYFNPFEDQGLNNPLSGSVPYLEYTASDSMIKFFNAIEQYLSF